MHQRGELLTGLADGWNRLGNKEKARVYFALLLGIKSLLAPEKRHLTVLLKKSADGQYEWVNADGFSYEEYADRIRMRWAAKEIEIYT